MKRLNTLNDIRRFLAKVANDLNDDKITEGKARTLGYVCSILSQVVKDSEIEKRIDELEKRIEGGKQ
jgi:hypothetical protein